VCGYNTVLAWDAELLKERHGVTHRFPIALAPHHDTHQR